jgi:hypothetical protein
MELQWRWLGEMETGKGRQWGVIIIGGEERDEVRRLHGARGEQHSKERHDGQGG